MTEDQPPEEPSAPATAPAPPLNQLEMPLADLARAILDRQITRPRITTMRRLAEALLAKKAAKAKKKAGKGGKKNRKLARIPGQKSGQKGR